MVKASGSSTSSSTDYSSGLPVWVRLVRNGDGIAAFFSADGASWSELDGTNINNLPETVYIGIAGASHQSSGVATGIVDDFEVCPADGDADSCQAYSDDFDDGVVTGWTDLDINSAPGSSSETDTITVSGGVAEVRQVADWVSPFGGGEGAVRWAVEKLLRAGGHWGTIMGRYA